jgi:predicted regulator of Ras-like GTPase activity (Roadblock/LC7/MglB family)
VLNPLTEIKGVLHALILSVDGMVVAASDGLADAEAEGIAAMSSALHGAARSATNSALRAPTSTPVETVTVQTQNGTYMMMPAGAASNAFIAVAGADKMPMGVTAHTMARQARKLGEHLMSVAARTDDGISGGAS